MTRIGLTLLLAGSLALGCDSPGEGGGGSGTLPPGSDTGATPADGGGTADGVDDISASVDCLANLGAGTLSGTVQGQTLQATHAGGVEMTLWGMTGYAIAFAAEGGTCKSAASMSVLTPLMVQLCSNAPGVHDIEESCTGEGTSMSFSNSVKITVEGEDISATSGTVTLDAFDAACGGAVRGSFAVDFDGEAVTGTFNTVGCGSIAF